MYLQTHPVINEESVELELPEGVAEIPTKRLLLPVRSGEGDDSISGVGIAGAAGNSSGINHFSI